MTVVVLLTHIARSSSRYKKPSIKTGIAAIWKTMHFVSKQDARRDTLKIAQKSFLFYADTKTDDTGLDQKRDENQNDELEKSSFYNEPITSLQN